MVGLRSSTNVLRCFRSLGLLHTDPRLLSSACFVYIFSCGCSTIKGTTLANMASRSETESSRFSTLHDNPFATPELSAAPTQEKHDSYSYFPQSQLSMRPCKCPSELLLKTTVEAWAPRRRKFQSARLKPGEYDQKPWLTGKEDPNLKRRRWERVIFWTSIAVGILLGAAICAYQ